MANQETRGCYWGITKNGELRRIWEERKGGSIILINSDNFVNHPVHPSNKGNVKGEVSIVFNLSDIEYVSANMFGSESEKKLIENLKDKAAALKN